MTDRSTEAGKENARAKRAVSANKLASANKTRVADKTSDEGTSINRNPLGGRVKVRLVKSTIGCKQAHRDTVRGLGLRRVNSVSELEDTSAVRGMINRVNYLVRVED
jgi:large subunit ribosomal protein L30